MPKLELFLLEISLNNNSVKLGNVMLEFSFGKVYVYVSELEVKGKCILVQLDCPINSCRTHAWNSVAKTLQQPKSDVTLTLLILHE